MPCPYLLKDLALFVSTLPTRPRGCARGSWSREIRCGRRSSPRPKPRIRRCRWLLHWPLLPRLWVCRCPWLLLRLRLGGLLPRPALPRLDWLSDHEDECIWVARLPFCRLALQVDHGLPAIYLYSANGEISKPCYLHCIAVHQSACHQNVFARLNRPVLLGRCRPACLYL